MVQSVGTGHAYRGGFVPDAVGVGRHAGLDRIQKLPGSCGPAVSVQEPAEPTGAPAKSQSKNTVSLP